LFLVLFMEFLRIQPRAEAAQTLGPTNHATTGAL
jgi:hypothetical protein